MTPCLTTDALCRSEREPATPFLMRCADGEILSVSRLLRVLPGKRFTGEAIWRNRRVLVKLFVSHGARRRWMREQQGLALLRDAGLPTPEAAAAGQLDGNGYCLLTEFFADSRTLVERWAAVEALPPGDARTLDVLRPALALFGRLHAAGLIQADPHLGNFLEHADVLFLIDGDGVARVRGNPAKQARQRLNNLALLLAQLPPSWESRLDTLLAAYVSEQTHAPPKRGDLLRALDLARAQRLSHFLGKTLRDCSQFAVQRAFRRFTSIVRAEREMLRPLLGTPQGMQGMDKAIAAGALLKDGNTCTVARTDVNNRALVIKRYNLKNLSHAVSRCWRPSRAWHAWLAGHRLRFYGIPTPAPLALIEERAGPLRRRAFLVTEFCPGDNLLQRLSAGREPDASEAAAITTLFNLLFRLRITHGDMKATNFLWHDERLTLIDLDAMIQHESDASFTRAWRRDRARFLRNWPEDSALCRWLDAHLPQVSMTRGLKIMAHEDFLALKAGAEVLEFDHHGEKVLRLTDGRILKLFRRKRLITSAMWRPYARRFMNNAGALALRGIPVPRVIEAWRIPSVKRDAVLYWPLEGTTLRALIRHETGESENRTKRLFTDFVIRLHSLGIYFRSLHLGNVVLTPAGELGLIDFSDMRLYRRPLPVFMRRRNIRRMLENPGERGWIDAEAILGAKIDARG